MRIAYFEKSVTARLLAAAALLLMLAGSGQAFAQERERDRGPVSDRIYMGLVLAIREPEEQILIEGQEIRFDRDKITVRYLGREVDSFMLTPGLNIRYTVDREGYLKDVFLVSPRDVIEGRLIQ